MSDRITITHPTTQPTTRPVTLASRGKMWGLLFDQGRYLEVAQRGCVVTFDLWESARLGRAVVVLVEEGGGA